MVLLLWITGAHTLHTNQRYSDTSNINKDAFDTAGNFTNDGIISAPIVFIPLNGSPVNGTKPEPAITNTAKPPDAIVPQLTSKSRAAPSIMSQPHTRSSTLLRNVRGTTTVVGNTMKDAFHDTSTAPPAPIETTVGGVNNSGTTYFTRSPIVQTENETTTKMDTVTSNSITATHPTMSPSSIDNTSSSVPSRNMSVYTTKHAANYTATATSASLTQYVPLTDMINNTNSTDELLNVTIDPSRLVRTFSDDFRSPDSFWPIAITLTIGIPTIVILAVTITVLYRGRLTKPKSVLAMYGQDYQTM